MVNQAGLDQSGVRAETSWPGRSFTGPPRMSVRKMVASVMVN